MYLARSAPCHHRPLRHEGDTVARSAPHTVGQVEVEGQYLTGRGVGTTKIILVRTGEQNQGVIGLHQSGIPGEIAPSLSARLMGLDKFGVASYLLTKYFSLASLTDDAIAVLENVEVGYYHDYQKK